MKKVASLLFENCIDSELFKDKSQLTEMMCPINYGVLNDPVSLSCCGNVFCKVCISEWLTKKNLCPCCRNTVDAPVGQPILLIKNSIFRKEVCCKNKSKGCEWEGQLEKLYEHFENNCGFHEIHCEYCLESCLLKDIPAHQENCLMRPIKCEHCHGQHLFSETKAHEDVCEEREITCTECKSAIKRKNKSAHLGNDCPESTVICFAKSFGCTKSVPRKTLDRHCIEEHSDIMMKIVFCEYPKIVALYQKQQAMLEELSSKMLVLEDKISSDFQKSFLKTEDFLLIKSWIDPNPKNVYLNCLFKSSVHGNSLDVFHSLCDNRGPTLTVLKTDKDYIIGGFTNISWSSEGKEKSVFDPSAFLFSINLKKKFEPLKTQKKENVYISRKFGPSFYWSLLLWRDGNVNDNLFGYHVYSAFNLSPHDENAGLALIGTRGNGYIGFSVNELEVYSVDVRT